jgi:hypothetical protein
LSEQRSVYHDIVESLVLDGMREQLRDSRLIEAYVRTYNTQRERAAATTSTAKAGLESKLASLAAERNRMVDLIVKGAIDEEDGRQRLAAMKVRRQESVLGGHAADQGPQSAIGWRPVFALQLERRRQYVRHP